MKRRALLQLVLAICLGAPLASAVAGPREDVMGASARCAAVARGGCALPGGGTSASCAGGAGESPKRARMAWAAP